MSALLGRYRAYLHLTEANFAKLQQEWAQDHHTERASKTALILAWICWGRASQLVSLDQFADALATADTGLAFLKRAENGSAWQVTFVFLRVLRAVAISHLGDPVRADQFLCEVLDSLAQPDARRWLPEPEVTLPRWQAWVNVQRGSVLARLGRYAEAIRVDEQAIAQFAADGPRLSFASAWVGLLLYLQGAYAEARQRVQASLNDWQARGDRGGIGMGFAFLAEIEATIGEVIQAHDHFRRSLAIARGLTAMDWFASALKAWAGWSWSWGDQAELPNCTGNR